MRNILKGLIGLILTTSLFAGFTWDAQSGYSSADGILEERLASGTENPDALRLMNQAADLLSKRGEDDEKARKTFRKVVRAYPTSLLAPEAHYQIGKIRMAQNKIDKAFESFGQIVEGYPNYSNFNELIDEMFSIAQRISVEKTSNFLGWHFRDRQKAIDAFEKIVAAAPYSDYAPKALFTIAKLYRDKGEELSAIDAYERLIGSYPNSAYTADAFLSVADIYRSMVAGAPYDQGATNQAIRYYDEFTALYPSDERVTEAQSKRAQMRDVLAQSKYNLALFYLDKRGNETAAVSLLKETIQTAPESNSAEQAQKVLEQITNGTRNAQKVSTTKKLLDTLTFWKKSDNKE